MARGPKPLKKALTTNQFYCVSCRSRKTIPADDISAKTFKNKKRLNGKVPMVYAECGKCDCKVYKIIKNSVARKSWGLKV